MMNEPAIAPCRFAHGRNVAKVRDRGETGNTADAAALLSAEIRDHSDSARAVARAVAGRVAALAAGGRTFTTF